MKTLETIATVFITGMIISCENKSNNQKQNLNDTLSNNAKVVSAPKVVINDKNVYDDINLFKLEGINKIKHPTSYPYIKIETSNNLTKKIVYKVSAKDSIERIYKRNGIYWTTSFESKADTGYCTIYEFITPNKIIELDYLGTYQKTNYHLHDASLIYKDSSTIYGFGGEKGLDILPSPHNVEVVRKKATTFMTNKIYIQNDKLLRVWIRIDTDHGGNYYSDTACFQPNNRSWFWWRYFTGNKINCN